MDEKRRQQLRADLEEIQATASELAQKVEATVRGVAAARRVVPAVFKAHVESLKKLRDDVRKLFNDAAS